MPNRSKAKGSVFERELVKALQAHGLTAERAYASNGRALGESDDVDIVFYDRGGFKWTVQAKRRAALPSYIKPPPGAKITMLREDRGETMVVIPLELFLSMV